MADLQPTSAPRPRTPATPGANTPPPFQPTNGLEQQLWKASKGKPDAQAFYANFLNSSIFFVNKDNEDLKLDEQSRLTANSTLRLPSVGYQGKRYLAVFSSRTTLAQANGANAPFLAIRGIDMLRMTRGVDIFLNPTLPVGRILPADELTQVLQDVWLNRAMRTELPAGLVLQPVAADSEHAPLMDELRKFFRRQPKVERAFLAEVVFSDTDRRATLCVIEAKGSWDKICQAAAKVFEHHETIVKAPFDFFRFGEQDDIDAQFANAQPFYTA